MPLFRLGILAQKQYYSPRYERLLLFFRFAFDLYFNYIDFMLLIILQLPIY